MEIEERLNALLSRCVWVKDASTALRLVPSLAMDLPPLINLPGGGVCLPIACAEPLLVSTAEVLTGVGVGGLESREAIQAADRSTLWADPLVSTLAGLMAETARPTLTNHAVPGLVAAWACCQLLGGSGAYRGPREREINVLRAAIQGLPSDRKSVGLANLLWSVSGRIGAAGAMARQAGWSVRVAGLARALLTSPLALCRPASSLQTPADFAEAASILGSDIDAGLLEALVKAGSAAVKASRARLQGGKSRPVDLELAALLGDTAPEAALFVPGMGARLPLMLSDLADVSDLTGAGISKDRAKALLKGSTARAIGAAWRELQVDLLRWDIFSALISMLAPVKLQSGRWRVEPGVLPVGPWQLLSPQRNRKATEQLIVAVNLTPLQEAARKVAAAQNQPILTGLIEREWRRVAQDASMTLRHSGFGIALFADPLQALNFALKAHQTLSGLTQLDMGELGDPIRLLEAPSVSVGVAMGNLQGGFDGRSIWLEGATFSQALSLCGSAAADRAADDPLGARSAHIGPAGFHSSGVVLSARAIESVIEKVQAARSRLHRHGSGGMAAGLSADFQVYPVQAWWETPTGTLAVLGLTSAEGGAGEILSMETNAFAELHTSDSMLAQSRQAFSTPSGPAPAAAADPFAEDEQETDSFASISDDAPSSDPFATDAFSADPFADSAPSEDDALSSDPFLTSEPDEPTPFDPFLADAPHDIDDEPTIMATIPPLAPPPKSEQMPYIEDDEPDTSDVDLDFEDDEEPARPAPPMLFDDDDEDSVVTPSPLSHEPAPPMLFDDDEEEEEAPVADYIGEGSVSYESEAEDVFMLTEDDEDEIIATGGYDYEDDFEEDDYAEASPGSSLTYGNPFNSPPGGKEEPAAKPVEAAPPMIFDDELEFEDTPDDSTFSLPPELSVEESDEDESAEFSFTGDGPDESASFSFTMEDEPEVGVEDDDEEEEEYSFEMDTEEPPAAAPLTAPMMLEDEFDEDDGDVGFEMPTTQFASPDFLDDIDPFAEDTAEAPAGDPFALVDEDAPASDPFVPGEDLDLTEEPGAGFAFVAPESEPEEAEVAVAAEEPAEEEGPFVEDDSVSDAFLNTDIAKIFKRYVVAEPRSGRFTFGLLDDRFLRDAHHYDCSDLDQAYLQFLSDKMREGFMPQIHLTAELAGLETGPMDMHYLEKAYQQMMGGS